MSNVSAVVVEDLFANPRPGQIKYGRWNTDPDDAPAAYLHFRCPCGCECVGSLNFRAYPGSAMPVWTWNGDEAKPTCTPSIGFYGRNAIEDGHHWHGYLTDGEFVPC
jgi:hypothetical protein